MTQSSRKEHVDSAISHYSSLFNLPTYRNVIALLFVQCIITGVAAVLPFRFSLWDSFLGLSAGILLFIVTIIADYVTNRLLLKNDLILNLRRCLFLSFSSDILLLFFVLLGSLIMTLLGIPNLWAIMFSLGVFALLSLRFLVFLSVSFVRAKNIVFATLLQPTLFLIAFVFSQELILAVPNLISYLSLFIAYITAFIGSYLFVKSVDSVGRTFAGIPSIKLFKAFLANWTQGLQGPFEEILERFSEERDIQTSMLAFRTERGLKAVMVVPSLHPGPFKNIGSSPIPGLIQESLENKLSCVVSVPHGISGHELDLASQAQNKIVIDHIAKSADFKSFDPYATEFVRASIDGASVSCQIFGDSALLTLTLSPGSMEDLPIELSEIISREAERRELACAISIDAHNSVDGTFIPEKAIQPLGNAAVAALEKSASLRLSSFEVGAAKVVPDDLGIKDGVGPGAITAIIVKVNEKKTAYVTIDGNNMVSNLREKMLSALREMNIDNGEILTTDTHVVNAVVVTGRGYYPLGEKIDHEKLIKYVKMAAAEASQNMMPAKASFAKGRIWGVKVIGESQLDNLSLIVDKTARKAKKSAAIIFPILIMLLAMLFVFI